MSETKEKESNQKLYKVRIYKDFEFPSFSIDKNNRLQDLYIHSLDEISENFNQNEGYFELEVTHVLPFEIKTGENKLNTRRAAYDFNFFIREIALFDTEAKFGELDYEKNPTIFDKRSKNNHELTARSSYNVKIEVEDFYEERVRHYYKILENKLV